MSIRTKYVYMHYALKLPTVNPQHMHKGCGSCFVCMSGTNLTAYTYICSYLIL